MSTPQPRWFTETEEGHSERYRDKFRALAADGADLSGEARFTDMMAERHSRILDAGCGGGRLSGALADAGHLVFAVDADPVLVEAAGEDHPGPVYNVCDLTQLSLAETAGDPVDLVVSAGNVLVFVAPDTERQVIANLAAVVRPGGRIVLGFRREETYPFERFEADVADLGLTLEHRFATWHLDPFTDESDFAVSVLRVPGA